MICGGQTKQEDLQTILDSVVEKCTEVDLSNRKLLSMLMVQDRTYQSNQISGMTIYLIIMGRTAQASLSKFCRDLEQSLRISR